MASPPLLYEDRYRRDLGDGLLVRWSTARDADGIAALYADAFRDRADAPPNTFLPAWARELLSGEHPNIRPRDFAVVEQTRTGAIVASTCLLRYQCAFDGISFGFGRPELVATAPEYRRRGLIRAIFELVHAKSEAGGDLMQGITGIPYYYRQFGYEYAVELSQTLRLEFAAIPARVNGSAEPYTLRAATPEDLPLMHRLWERDRASVALSTVFDDTYWRWMMRPLHQEALPRWRGFLIVGEFGVPVGFILLVPRRWSPSVLVDGVFLERGVPLVSVLPSLLRGVRALADVAPPSNPGTPPAAAISFRVGSDNPLSRSLEALPFTSDLHPYAWYIRVPDLPHFIHHIAPALEARLAASAQSGYTGALTLDFYRGGLRLDFARGKLTAAENYVVPLWGEPTGSFPPLVFLQLLCGYHSLDELRMAFPDVWTQGDGAPLLQALFPRRPSQLVPLD